MLNKNQENLANAHLTKAEVIRLERKLAKYANVMDSLVRIPFTKQGVGVDAMLSTIPLAGDIVGLLLTLYVFKIGKKLGVPTEKMAPALKMAVVDMFIGTIPVLGTIADIFIQPSRQTLAIVHQHVKENYDIQDEIHLERPFLHEQLEKKQRNSTFWRNPVIAWLYLHMPDILGLIVIVLMIWIMFAFVGWIITILQGLW